MKTLNILSVLLVVLLLPNCNSTTVETEDNPIVKIVDGDDSQFSDSLKSLLQEDAATLALRDLQSDPSKKGTVIFILDYIVESYYRGLVYIYNAASIPEADQVVNKYKIHVFGYPETHRLFVSVDTSKAWTEAWRNGESLTGNPQVDSLIINYNLKLYRYYTSLNGAVLYATQPLNIFALSKKFVGIEGINYSEPDGIMGDGNDITASIDESFITYTFSYGWGDCPAGCIGRHYWEFQVMFDGTVQFIRSYGDQLY